MLTIASATSSTKTGCNRGTAAADQRQYRQQSGKLGECAEQCVARAKHGARADDRGFRKRLLDHLFAASSSADVRRPGIWIGADAGDMHEAGDAGRDCLPRYGLGPLHVHGLEGQATLLDIGPRPC